MNIQTTNKKAVIYCRVSTKEQVEEGNSLVTQERNCREYAIKYGYEIAYVFVEQGESAKTADRTELQKLFTFCANKKNEIQAIIAYKIDRISRNTDDYSQIRILLKRYGVEIKSTSEYFENTPAGRFMENIIANVAQFDNDVRAERCVGGMLQALRDGRYVWMAPIGYSNSKIIGKTNLIQNEKAPLIKLAFEEVAGRIYTVEETRFRLATLGLTTKKGDALSKSHFYTLLRNEIYTGTMKKFGETNIGNFEPIISNQLFTTVQNVLRKKKRTQPYLMEHPDFPLRRFVTHSISGEKLTGSWSQGRRKKYPYYRFIINKMQFTKKYIEDKFSEFLNNLSFNEKLLEFLKSEIRENIIKRTSTNQEAIKKNKNQEIKLKEQQKSLIKKNLDGIISDAVLKESMDSIEEERWKLQQFFVQKEEKTFDLASVLEYLYQFLENPAETWKNLPFVSKVKLQWFVFPKGITFDGTEIRTAEISFVFKVKDAILASLYSTVDYPNNTTDTQNMQKALSLTETEKVIFWQQLEKDLIDLGILLTLEEAQQKTIEPLFSKSTPKRGG